MNTKELGSKIDQAADKVQHAASKVIEKTKEAAAKGVEAATELQQKVAEVVTASSHKIAEGATKLGHDVKHATSHAAHTLEEKARPYPSSPSGMPGVQTLLPVMLGHVADGRLTLERLVDLCAHGPARTFGLARKGRLIPGNDADLVLVDLKARHTITNAWSKSRCGWTPFDGREVTGWPVATLVRGRTVMRDGQLVGSARGEPATFLPW